MWSNKAKIALKDHYDWIKLDSKSAADKVRQEIIRASKELAFNPDRYQLDEYYPNNPGNIRRFFKWSYRIVFQVQDDHVAILNVIHTSQEPSKN
ncbi:type II toxin-antitoxin system RelE/ParE family toxin [Mongoliibacter ruber]|uniref:Plasmid stabilization system protein ParE n=1 Tax=Mongoliibacter ruber TaxID=1750599 RepID=A0A2T0WGZ3_9BACT|nr:type II toxin-antitoxin system RelE/ParE family toxin [Mongoliibacter ruber]PRY85956.1 plasmid stabilization system protein ParE [Mongoliibacter ruber]